MNDSVAAPTRVVILGGGLAGVYTAKYLTEQLGRRADVQVELLSEENYFVFQPLLPEVAAGGIAATHVVNPIRELVPRVRFRCCSVVNIDFERKCVRVSQGAGLELVEVPYDHLVFCLGKVTHFASMPGVAEHALAMKDLFFPRDITQLQVFQHQHLHVHHYEPGEAIVRQGQVGRESYLILKGEVEVSSSSGASLVRLGAREVFGERALLEDTRRNATVRATQASDVLVMSRSDFHALVRNLPVLSDYFAELLRSRHPDAMPARVTAELRPN